MKLTPTKAKIQVAESWLKLMAKEGVIRTESKKVFNAAELALHHIQTLASL